MVPAHAAGLGSVLLDPVAYAFIPTGPPKSMDELAAQIRKRMAGPSAGHATERWWNVAVFLSEGGRGVGWLQATLIQDRAEVAYLFGSDHWGKGYAREAMDWFQRRLVEDGQALKFWATVQPANERSIRFLHRLGYKPVRKDWPELRSYDEGDLVFCRAGS